MIFISQTKKIISLVSELIYLNHPIILDIRWQFYTNLCGIDCKAGWESREQWQEVINNYDYSLPKFIRTFIEQEQFRINIIRVFQYEKEKLLDAKLLNAKQEALNDIN